MRRCLHCGEKLGVIRSVFLRGDVCSTRCLEAYNRDDEAVRLIWGADREKQDVKDSAVTQPRRTSTDEAHAAIWTGILAAAKHLGKRESLPTKRYSSEVQLRKGTAETPVYFIGAGLIEFRLAQLIYSERSIFGIEIRWPLAWRNAATKNDTYALPTMEQLVAPYVAALSVHTGSSPCVLAGHSFNGLMAFEAAHQLQEQGGKVEMVILLDTSARYPAPHQVAWQKLHKDWKRAPNPRSTDRASQSIVCRLGSSLSIIRWALTKEMRGLGRRFVRWLRDPGVIPTRLDELGIPLHEALIGRLNAGALRFYRLRRLDCHGVLFRADPRDERPARALDGSLGWDNLFSRGLEIIPVTGDHVAMVRQPPHDLTLGREMSKLLNRSCFDRVSETPSDGRGDAVADGTTTVGVGEVRTS